MRYVTLAVAIGLLVIGISAYTATAAQGKAAKDSRLDHGVGIVSAKLITPPSRIEALTAARGQYVAVKEQERQRQEQERLRLEQERQDREATERFGFWGPDLVRAAAQYGQDPAELYRVMLCESGGDQYADNGVCKGLFQFNPGTWAGTPYGGSDIFDGHAQIWAAAWMWSQGRQYEWTCF